jgi:hypothetical protein
MGLKLWPSAGAFVALTTHLVASYPLLDCHFHTVVYEQETEDAFAAVALNPTFAFVDSPFCPTLNFVFAFWIMILFDIGVQ